MAPQSGSRVRPARPEPGTYSAVLYLGQMPARGRVTGSIASDQGVCGDVLVSVEGVDASGERHAVGRVRVSVSESGSFTLPFVRGGAAHLLVTFEASDEQTAESCRIGVDKLSVLGDS